MQDNWQLVGKVKDAHSLKGELYIIVFSKDLSWLKELKEFQLRSDNHQQTFQVIKASAHKDGLIMRTNEVKDRTAAEGLKGQLFYISKDFFISKPGESMYLLEIEGFTVRDEKEAEIGTIIGFSSNGAQDLLLVKGLEYTHEIPFVEAYVMNIDFEKQTIQMKLPEGLLEVASWGSKE